MFGASLGFTLAMILHFWVRPAFIYLPSRLTKKRMAETYAGDQVYEDRYRLRWFQMTIVALVTLVLPLIIAVMVLNSYGDEIDEDFKDEVIL